MSEAPVAPAPEVLRVLDRLELVTGLVRGRAGGAHDSVSLGTGTRFEDFRHYTPGDDLRYLDWNALGRLGEPFIKRFRREEAGRVSLIVDCTASMSALTPDVPMTARSAAAILGYAALGSGYEVDVLLAPPDDAARGRVGAWRGRGSAAELFAHIASLRFDVAGPLLPALRAAAGRRDLGAAAVFISDFADPDGGERVFRFFRSRRVRATLIQVKQPTIEWADGLHRVIDPESGRTIERPVNASVRRDIADRRRRFDERIRRRARAFGMVHTALDPGVGPVRSLVAALERGGALR